MSVPDGSGGGTAPRTAERRPFGVVVASAVEGFRTLARKHVELAKVEMAEAASARLQGVGMIVAAAVVAVYAIGFVAAAGAAGLAVVLPTWAAILIVGVLLLAIAAVLVAVARRVIKTAPPAGERTKESLKEGAAWAKQQIGR